MKFGAREVLFLVVMLGLLFSSWYFVFRKADEKIAKLQADTVQKQQQLEQLETATRRIQDMNRKIEELQALIQQFEAQIPKQNETGGIVRQIDKQTKGRRLLEVQKFNASAKPEKASGYSELPIQIVMAGDFRSFYDFLLEIERMTRITRINKLNISKMQEVDGSMKADLTLSIFYSPTSK